MLHLLAKGMEEGNDKAGNYLSANKATIDLFDVTKQHRTDVLLTGADNGCSFEIPILPDKYGDTPLDICMGIDVTSSTVIGGSEHVF